MNTHVNYQKYNQTDKPSNYINYKELPLKRCRVKFFNSAPDKKFGFVTILDDNNKPLFDAFLSGAVLEKAGIYNLPERIKEEKEDIIYYVRHVPKDKGEAVVYMQQIPPPSTVNYEEDSEEVDPPYVEDQQ